MERKTELT